MANAFGSPAEAGGWFTANPGMGSLIQQWYPNWQQGDWGLSPDAQGWVNANPEAVGWLNQNLRLGLTPTQQAQVNAGTPPTGIQSSLNPAPGGRGGGWMGQAALRSPTWGQRADWHGMTQPFVPSGNGATGGLQGISSGLTGWGLYPPGSAERGQDSARMAQRYAANGPGWGV